MSEETTVEPITTTILSALAAGAIAATKDTATKAVKDGYQALKKLVEQRFAGEPVAETALAEHTKKLDDWQRPLQTALTETGADKDEEILRRATGLLKDVEKAAVAAVSVHGSGAAASHKGVAASRGSYAAGRDMVIGQPPRKKGRSKPGKS